LQRRLYLYDVVAAAVIARVMLGVFAVDKISRRHFVKYCAVLSFYSTPTVASQMLPFSYPESLLI
jgi:dolichyl-phosphate-mannose--protein O-mannosyl transferase